MRINSIRQMIFIGVNTVVIVLLGITGFITYSSTHHELDELFDAQLAQYTRLINQLVVQTLSKPSGELPVIVSIADIKEDNIERTSAEERRVEGHKYEEKLAFQVWTTKGNLLLRSSNAGTEPLAPLKAGYHDVFISPHKWIFYSLYNSGNQTWTMTGQREDVRGELSLYLTFDQLIPLGISLLPVTVLIWLSVYWGIKPIRDLSKALSRSQPSLLTPLDIELPVELKPFQIAINQLLDDLKRHIENEKRFVANASHELRTPLSILLVHADNIRNAKTNDDCTFAAEAIMVSTKRLTHLVTQLMEIEKLEHGGGGATSSINLSQLIRDSLALVESSLLSNVNWAISIDSQINILGDKNLLQVVFRNLLDNAAKYSLPLSEVNISAQDKDCCITITIINQISKEIQLNTGRMGERFYRHVRSQGVSGSGLGLSIVTKILSMHDAKISYEPIEQNYLKVVVDFA
ncbi:integral membrane sensor signal transduction histidine kinase [Cellvibrio sp. BR]|uniref:sensor histidine kinase n=1 Tax=Cellvibrio sp. BR TaxID=1134474 RepID=UPI0002600ACF|nr:ATP-binding protein [Cellvibrio sp. BR]EIK43204.1 integral membrane sensor signal transduction histidine kinase [Cellvibrio sp. BR]